MGWKRKARLVLESKLSGQELLTFELGKKSIQNSLQNLNPDMWPFKKKSVF